MNITASDIKNLRELTNCGVMECKRALEEAQGDVEKAKAALREQGIAKAAKKSSRETGNGIVHSYIHSGSRLGVMVKLLCETDFAAGTPAFTELAHNIALQVAAIKPEDTNSLLESAYIKDSSLKVSDLITNTVAVIGENIRLESYCILEI